MKAIRHARNFMAEVSLIGRDGNGVFSVNSQHKRRKQVQSDPLITILVARVAHGSIQQARYRKIINTLL
ncbi:hypothetical protein FJW01_08400 [Pantoea deleyi]|uniref:Uncharacterized protein n=2 Tax=Pantoea deleyi TaxID=470932 RepID=A0A506QAJ2_9GAMM|nr:hypothetical protein [Pantoea deleyi]TPV42837.1 hypothetical protein FJW01_08400 [Pantoea deleyi]